VGGGVGGKGRGGGGSEGGRREGGTIVNYIMIMTQKRLERHACTQQTQYKVIASFLQGKQVCSHFLKGGRPSFD